MTLFCTYLNSDHWPLSIDIPRSFFVATICNLLTKVCSYNTFETRAFKPNPTDYLDSKLVTIQSTFIQWKTLFLGQHNTTSASRSYIDQLSKFWVHCFKMLKNFTFLFMVRAYILISGIKLKKKNFCIFFSFFQNS